MITIKWASTIGNAQFIPGWSGGGDIVIDPSLQGESTNLLASTIGHEGFHAVIWQELGLGNRSENFAANEAFAYSFDYAIGQKLGINVGGLSAKFSDINPYLPSDQLNQKLTNAAQTLYDANPFYSRQEWWQRWFTGGSEPLNIWSDNDENGSKFLTVAKEVWIK